MERRQSTRIPFKVPAVVLQNGKSISGETRDISKNGIFISTHCHYEEGDKARVSLSLHNEKTSLSVTLPCAIARVSNSGIGCISLNLEPETLLFMSNLIHSRKIAPSEIMHAFYYHLDGLEHYAKT
jgi:hypothetical protein